MAKKKTKKSKFKLDLILNVAVLVLGVAALAMAFLVSVKFIPQHGDVATYTGFHAMFGYSKTTESVLGDVTTKHLAFSILNTLGFFLPLIGAVLSCFKNKIVKIVGAALMVAGAVLIFLVPTFTVLATVDGELNIVSTVLNACDRGLGIGAILGGVFAALGSLVSGYAIIKK